jgi:hypothetical protein
MNSRSVGGVSLVTPAWTARNPFTFAVAHAMIGFMDTEADALSTNKTAK